MLLEKHLGVLPALTDARLAIGPPRTAFADDIALERDIEDRPHLRDAFAVGDIEFGLPERRRDFVLDDLDARARAHHVGPDFDLFEFADIQAD